MFRGIMIVMLLAGGAAAQAQEAATPPPAAPAPTSERPQDLGRMRYHLGVMERIFEEAVAHGAQMLGQMMQSVSPNTLLFTGPARAKGFMLDGYGLFFDVEVPAVRRTVAWSLSVMNQQDLSLTRALQSLRQHVRNLPGDSRTDLEQALRRIELQVRPAVPPPGTPVTPDVENPDSARIAAMIDDPNEMYTGQVKQEIVDAMLDHSTAISLGPTEWLTVAARDNEDRLNSADRQAVFTIMLRVSGADLEAFRAGRITREEARNRVVIRQF
jgi:hypothetical protein